MESNKINCLIWPELNDYTGKSETIAYFSSEDDLDIVNFISNIHSFWNDLANWILNCNKNAADLSQSLKFWFSMQKLFLTENQIEKMINDENQRYLYLINIWRWRRR